MSIIQNDELQDIKQVITHFNYPQQKLWIVNANTTVFIGGRAIGKDHGVVAPVLIRNVKGMPRGATAFVTPTYIKAKIDMIPAIRKALEKFHLYEEIDYWIGKYIPSNIKHDTAFEQPGEAAYSIFFRNGHVVRIIGLDNKKTANGQSNDYLLLNEARFIKHEDFISRVKPTNRGNEDTFFADLHYHHGTLITTDMPRSSSGAWIKEFAKNVDQDQIDLIVSFDHELRSLIDNMADDLLTFNPKLTQQIRFDKEVLLEQMRNLVEDGKLTQALDKRFRKELARLENILFELRREAVYFLKASTLENIDVVGERFINEMFRDLSEKEFNTSILTEEDDGATDPFYATFNAEHHTYHDIDYNYIEAFPDADELPQPWKKDADVDPARKLEIACDWNKKITCMEIGQEFPHAFKILNSLEVFDPSRIKHLVEAFDKYYKGYPTRKVTHHFDHTAVGEDASREKSYAQELKEELQALGWIVDEHYIGQASTHRSRNKMFNKVYSGDDPNYKPTMINETNCENLRISLENAGSYQNEKGIQKNKKPELSTSPDVKQQHTTHHTDAHDTLYIGVFQARIGKDVYEPDFSI